MKYFIQAIVLTPFLFARDAHAYLDPGSASLIIQGLIAGVASAISLCALYWAKVKSFFTKNTDAVESDEVQANEEQK